MSNSLSGSSDKVLEFLCDRRFHRQFTYTHENKRHRLSYSDYGDPSSKAVVLFFGGLMGGRFSYSPLDHLATKHHIRIIHPDRPGVGGSDSVPLEARIPTYIATIPKLLAHLGIEHVSLAAHSFGTIYLLNTMLRYPNLLHPEKPYVAFFAPWVHPNHTGVTHLQVAELLPAGMIGKFSSVARFVNGTVTPLVGMSSGLSSVVSSSLKTSLPRSVGSEVAIPLAPRAGQRVDEGQRSEQRLDLKDPMVVCNLRKLIPTFLFAESVDGASHDAQLCLRKPRSVPWSTPELPWDDVDDAVGLFSQSLREDEQGRSQGRLWRVETFHAETDSMVGKRGREWFDACWVGDGHTLYTYDSCSVTGADHDFILDPIFGASEKWMERVSEAFGGIAVGSKV